MSKGKEIEVIRAELVNNYRDRVSVRSNVEYAPQPRKQVNIGKTIKYIGFAGFALSATVILVGGFSTIALGVMIFSLFMVTADQMIK